MPVFVAHRRTGLATLQRKFGTDVEVFDVTSKADEPWVHFSPFWPHGNIPVPFSSPLTSETVEGVWQALKVFQSEDVDLAKLRITNMKGLKRTVRRLGPVLGHRNGVDGKQLLTYRQAREQIYLPTYLWTLEHCLKQELNELKDRADDRPVVLLDYTTNGDLENLKTPLSHAALIQHAVENTWPV